MSQAMIQDCEATLADVRRKLHPGHGPLCDCSTCEGRAESAPVPSPQAPVPSGEYCGAQVTRGQAQAVMGLAGLALLLAACAAGELLLAWLGGK